MPEWVSNIDKNDLNYILKEFQFSSKIIKNKRNVLKIVSIENEFYVVKSFKKPNLIIGFIYKFFRETKAKRSFEYSLKLQKLGINVPNPIAYKVNSTSFTILDSYFICDFLKDSFEFRELIENPNFPDRLNIIRKFTHFTYDLHQKGIQFIYDSTGNTLIKRNNDKYDFYLIDVNRMNFEVEFDFEKRMENFIKLSATDDMIEIMSIEYAKLLNVDVSMVREKMIHYKSLAEKRKKRKKKWKHLLGIK